MSDSFQAGCTKIHFAAVSLASKSSESSANRYESSSNDIVRDAHYLLLHDAVCVFRAIFELTRSGWSDSAAALTRTLLDLRISQLAIINSDSPELAAFKYLYSGLRDFSRNAEFDRTARSSIRAQVRARIALLSPENQRLALAAIKDRTRPYWFAPEWASPSEVLTKFENSERSEDYRQYSSATHGGYFGLRTYREEPDKIDINPRASLGRRGCVIALMSSLILIDIIATRSNAEELNLMKECDGLKGEISTCASLHAGARSESRA